MEVLASAASVIAVVTLALQSTKVIYEITSSIGHGSDDVDRLARAISNLEKLLEAIKRLAEHAENTNSVAEGKLLEELTPLVNECVNALREVYPKIVQLQKDSSDRRWKKAKKYARVYLDTKGIAEIWNTVNHYVELLGSCLSNASVDVGLFNAQELHLLHDEFAAASRDNTFRFSQIEEILRDQRTLAQAGFDAFQAKIQQDSLDAGAAATTQIQGIAELKAAQQQYGMVAAAGYEKIGDLQTDIQCIGAMIDNKNHQATTRSDAFMTEIRGGISEVTNSASAQSEEVRHFKAEVMQKLHSISDQLEAVPSMANDQLLTLQSLVEMMSDIKLGIRTGAQNQPHTTANEAYPPGDHRNNESNPTYDAEVEGMVAKICHFAGTMTTYKYSKDAQTIIEDISRLLGLMMRRISATSPSRADLPRKRKVLSDYQYSELETEVQSMEDLAKAKRILAASLRVRISDQESRQIDEDDNLGALIPGHSQDSLPDSVRRRMASNANFQNIVRSWTLQHSRFDAIFRTMLHPDAEDQDTEIANEAFTAKLLLTPTSASVSSFQVIIDIASRAYQNRTVCFTPTLTFRAMIPSQSEVFHVVEGGSVKKLKKLLSSGVASLGDCDSMGRSLLNFALFKCRRKMTRFLIQSGADVDSLEPRKYSGCGDLVKPWNMLRWMNEAEMADEDLERREGCYKLLLDAGSDISSTHSFGSGEARYWMSAYSKELASGTLTNVKALLDLGEPFISLESTGDDMPYESTTPLLLLAGFHAWYYYLSPLTPAKIAFLLRRGANAKARNPGGETCLHRVLRHNHRAKDCWCEISSRTWRYLYQTKDILILMISAGADVCAIDKQGRSVSDVINHPGLETVWTEALKYCGIDIRDVVARPNLDPAHSTALDYQYREPLRSVTSKISLAEYLKRRNPAPERFKAARELSSSEEDESEDEVSVRDSGNLTEARQNKSITEDEEIDGSYEDIGARKKTKLE